MYDIFFKWFHHQKSPYLPPNLFLVQIDNDRSMFCVIGEIKTILRLLDMLNGLVLIRVDLLSLFYRSVIIKMCPAGDLLRGVFTCIFADWSDICGLCGHAGPS